MASRYWLPAFAGGLLLASFTAAAENSPTLKADRLLAEARAATGGNQWDRIRTWHESDQVSTGGLSGTAESWIDLQHGREQASFAVGPMKGSQGFDGKAAWSTDDSGQVRVEGSGEAAAQAMNKLYGDLLAYWYDKRHHATRAYVGQREADGATFEAIRIEAKGGLPFELWIDPATHRITRSVEIGGLQPHSFIFSDFRQVNGVTLPFQTVDRVGDPKFDTVTKIDHIDFNMPIPPEQLAMPKPPADDFTFPAGQDRVSLPIELVNNHIYVPAGINGRAAIPFVFDTGAINVLASATAAEAGVKEEGKLPMAGYGEDVATMAVTTVDTLNLGGLTLQHQRFFSTDMSPFTKVEGLPLNGLVGYEVAKRAVTVIDYAAGRITFVKPSAFTPPPGAVAVPFEFDEHVPVISAKLDGIPGKFVIDTGARHSLSLMTGFVKEHDLAGKYHAATEIVSGWGIGGPTRAQLARPSKLEIAPGIEVTSPVATLEHKTKGASAEIAIAGNIGSGTLKRFTLTLDYARRILYFQPNANAAVPDVADRAGLWLMAEDGGFTVYDVVANSPAAKAGLKSGDRIRMVDGQPAADISLAEMRERLKAVPGTRVKLDLADGRDATIDLADLI